MSTTVDTNVLVYASNDGAPEHERASALLAHLAEGPALVVLLWPAVLGYLRLATHPSIFASPLTPAQAEANVDALTQLPHVRVVGEIDGFWSTYRGVAGSVAPRGILVPDAHLVALMLQHGVSRMWSRDRDLRKFDGVTVADPFGDRYQTGFGGRPR